MSPTVCFSVVVEVSSLRSLFREKNLLGLGLNKEDDDELPNEAGSLFGLDFSSEGLCVELVDDRSLLKPDLNNLFFDLNLSRKLGLLDVLVGSVVLVVTSSSISFDSVSSFSSLFL